jgi:predicted Zn-dependent peptidase
MNRRRGIYNHGNDCFLNSTLQCLAVSPFIINIIDSYSSDDLKIINVIKKYDLGKFNSNKINTVHITFHIPIGASSENDDEHGIAHYLEHMLFTNTKKYKEDEINNLIDFYGANINAETQYDKTLFYINGNPEYTLELFDIIHEIYFNGIITIEKFEREKNIIIQELENELLTPGIKSDKIAHKLMFNDRYKKLVGGEIDDIHKITFDKLNNFKQKYYTPENTTIIFFGKFDNNLFKINKYGKN